MPRRSASVRLPALGAVTLRNRLPPCPV